MASSSFPTPGAPAGMPPNRPLNRRERRAIRIASRRRSILGPVVLVGVGVLILLLQLGRLDWHSTFTWYARWWPLLLIAAGAFLTVEWAVDRYRMQQPAADGQQAFAPRRVGGGVIWLLVLLAVVGACLHGGGTLNFDDTHNYHRVGFDLLHAVGTPHDSDESMTQTVTANGKVSIDNPQGDIVVNGKSPDGQVHISVHKQVYAFSDSDAADRAAKMRPSVLSGSGYVNVLVPQVIAGQADLTVSLPASVALTVTTGHGQVRVDGMQGEVIVNGNRGDVDLNNITGTVYAHMHSSGATFSAHGLAGPLTVDGHTGDVNISEVHGPVTLTGNFFGTTHLEKLGGPLKYHTSRTDLQIARLDGEVEFDTGAHLQADQLVGPVLLKTSDRVITLDGVQGDLQLENSNGAVEVTSAAPLGTVRLVNKRGSVTLNLPADAAFTVNASTRHGEIENDFAMHATDSDDAPALNGTVGHGGPDIQVQTSDGDVNLRKVVAALKAPVAQVHASSKH